MKNKLIILSHIVKEKYFKLKWYTWKRLPFNVTAVAVVDGRFYSGGLADRFKGMVSLFAWAKRRNIPFRIEYTMPFQLLDYLVPNKYDWTIKEGDFVRSIKAADIVYSVSEPTVIHRMRRKGINRQVHFYGNRDLLPSMNIKHQDWGEYFKELFKPAEKLQLTINRIKPTLGEKYFAAVFRFQNLLGDFPEYDFKPLDTKQEQDDLINGCLEKVIELIKIEGGKTCLVTSDSQLFLRIVSNLNGVKIIPGSLVHLGFNTNGNYEQYEKSFVDFYLLSESEKIYSIVSGNMYPSEFPLYAAKVNNIPFKRIIIN